MTTNLPPEGQEMTVELTIWIAQRLEAGVAPAHVSAKLVNAGWTWEAASQVVQASPEEPPTVAEEENSHPVDGDGSISNAVERTALESASRTRICPSCRQRIPAESEQCPSCASKLVPTTLGNLPVLVDVTWGAAFKIATAMLVLPVLVGIALVFLVLLAGVL